MLRDGNRRALRGRAIAVGLIAVVGFSALEGAAGDIQHAGANLNRRIRAFQGTAGDIQRTGIREVDRIGIGSRHRTAAHSHNRGSVNIAAVALNGGIIGVAGQVTRRVQRHRASEEHRAIGARSHVDARLNIQLDRRRIRLGIPLIVQIERIVARRRNAALGLGGILHRHICAGSQHKGAHSTGRDRLAVQVKCDLPGYVDR